MTKVWYKELPQRFWENSHPAIVHMLANPPEDYEFVKDKEQAEFAFMLNWVQPTEIPWVMEIEDVISLFIPHFWYGETARSANGAAFEGVRSKIQSSLEAAECKAIISHLHSTVDSLPLLFGEGIRTKCHYIPLSVSPSPYPAFRRESETTTILFQNSWSQREDNFYLRGGLDVLEAFRQLSKTQRHIKLIIHSVIPEALRSTYVDVLRHPAVSVIESILDISAYQKLIASADIFLLPSARIHIVCLLDAMTSGAVCIASDGWGNREIVKNHVTGLIIKGRYGKASWVDEKGMLREDYVSMFQPSEEISTGLFEAVNYLIDNPGELERLRQSAFDMVENNHLVKHWQSGLKRVFDSVLKKGG